MDLLKYEYTNDFGLEAGFDLLLMELEAEVWEAKIEIISYKKKCLKSALNRRHCWD